MKHRPSVAIPLLLLAAALLPAADSAPTAAEWAPVQQALESQAPDAQARLTTLLRTYPRWADGSKALARLLLDQDKYEEALAAAKRAGSLAGDDAETLRMQVRALAALKRPQEVWTLMDGAGGKDPRGWLSYEAGLAAVAFNEQAKAENFLKGARLRGGDKPPAEFLFLESRVAILAKDVPRAEAALTAATAQQSDFWDGWYELGRVRLVLADRAPDSAGRGQWIKKAGEAFAAVATGVPNDANGHIGLGRCALEKAKLLLGDGLPDQAGSSLRDAVAHFGRASERRPDLAEPYVLRGDALLRLERWDEAATSLARAKELGAGERSLVFNLAIALQQTGKVGEADALLKTITVSSPEEQATLGLGAYRSRNWLVAANLLEGAAPGLEDTTTRAATWRMAGHAQTQLAQGRSGAERELALDAAANDYQQAGDLGDFPARHFLVANEAARSPDKGYAAGWRAIGWDPLSREGWGQVLGSYGAAKTGGAGIGGMAGRAPLHLAAWTILLLLPLVFFVSNLRKRAAERRRERARDEQDDAKDDADREDGDERPAAPAPAAKPVKARTAGRGVAPVRRPPSSPAAAPAPSSDDRLRPKRPARAVPVQEKSMTEPLDGILSEEEKAVTETIVNKAPPARTPRPGARPPPTEPAPPAPPAGATETMVPTRSPAAGGNNGGGALERRRK